MAVRRLTLQTRPRGAPGSGRCALSLVAWHSMGSYDGAWRRSLRCNGRQADLRLAEAAVPDRPRHADISRSDLSQSLCSDARRAEEGADGTVAYKAADASR